MKTFDTVERPLEILRATGTAVPVSHCVPDVPEYPDVPVIDGSLRNFTLSVIPAPGTR